MISLTLPKDSAIDVYVACVERTKNPTLKTGLLAEAERVGLRSELYREKATAHALHTLLSEPPVNVSGTELSDVYNRVLVNGGERRVYDLLKSRARFRRCPLCAQRDVHTLDHYLPQSVYPELSVTPANLVPACRDCNSVKHHHVPSCSDDESFHPYFDDWSSERFVIATIKIEHRVEVIYSISGGSAPPAWLERARRHFKLFELGSLYSQEAAVELVQKKQQFTLTHAATGASGLKQELLTESQSRIQPFPNAWQPALYRGLAASDAFCDGGFKLIEE